MFDIPSLRHNYNLNLLKTIPYIIKILWPHKRPHIKVSNFSCFTQRYMRGGKKLQANRLTRYCIHIFFEKVNKTYEIPKIFI